MTNPEVEDDLTTEQLSMGILEWVLCTLLVGIVLVTFAQVLFRYVFQTSLSWTEELARYLFMWLAALGAAYAYKTKAHFLLRFVVDRFSLRSQLIAKTVVALLTGVFLVVFLWQAFIYVESVAGQRSPGTGLSKAVPASSAIVGGSLMLLYAMRNWLEDLRSFRVSKPRDDVG